MMLVDYAETRLSLASMLRAVADDSGGRLRVLLLARGAGEWWAQLEASSDASVRSLAAAAAQVLVGPELGPSATADDLVLSAVRAFSHELGITMPDRVAAETRPGPMPILVLHGAALLAVLDAKEHDQAARPVPRCDHAPG